MAENSLKVTVIICAYTDRRWDDLLTAINSMSQQGIAPDQIIIVIDHNSDLFARTKSHFSNATVVENTQARGLSGARNTGIRLASGDIIAFMDEDAYAESDWLEALIAIYNDPNVLGVGGKINPVWLKPQPSWFPGEFRWVVGCTYLGMPVSQTSVRNLIGCNMSFRSSVFGKIDGFRNDIGRVGIRPVGCEETELCIRIRQTIPHSKLIYSPAAVVNHRVPASRGTWSYFLSRCYSEGLSKALVTLYVGSKDGLASERTYMTKTLPFGIFHGLTVGLSGKDRNGFGKSIAIITGLMYTGIGYLVGTITLALSRTNKRYV